jgi:DNA-binding transcriptional regulator YdaS (Cro superfamily)
LKPTRLDKELKEAAVRRAGGASLLAGLLGVTPGAVSQWGRSRPIPRHVKPRLENYLRASGTEVASHEIAGLERMALPAGGDALLRLLQVLPGSRLAHLPRRYRRRYATRVEETITRVMRELEEYQTVLEAEHRLGRTRKGRAGGTPEE